MTKHEERVELSNRWTRFKEKAGKLGAAGWLLLLAAVGLVAGGAVLSVALTTAALNVVGLNLEHGLGTYAAIVWLGVVLIFIVGAGSTPGGKR